MIQLSRNHSNMKIQTIKYIFAYSNIAQKSTRRAFTQIDSFLYNSIPNYMPAGFARNMQISHAFLCLKLIKLRFNHAHKPFKKVAPFNSDDIFRSIFRKVNL